MLLTCKCSAVCRIPSLPKARVRCGKCQHTFTPAELCKAKPEDPPKREMPIDGSDGGVKSFLDLFMLKNQRDFGAEEMINDGKCPECLGELRSDGYCVKCGQFYEVTD